jgi:hypothetical protein
VADAPGGIGVGADDLAPVPQPSAADVAGPAANVGGRGTVRARRRAGRAR